MIFYRVIRCVVWTGDGRVFFFNPSTRSSVWEKPEELQNRVDVDKLISNSPDSQPGPIYYHHLFIYII